MTDNEQRAHDIAVAALMVPFMRETPGTGLSIDIYEEYIENYDRVLHALRKDYPGCG